MNCVVIVANGWNAGWLGCYGNEWLQTPHVDRLAAESVVFNQHYAVNPSPGEWDRSLLSGCFEFAANPRRPSAVGLLRQQGVRTVRIANARTSVPGADWDHSIDVVRAEVEPPGKELHRIVVEQLRELSKVERWLLWIETDRLLPPWSVSLDEFDHYVESISRGESDPVPQPWDEPPIGKHLLDDVAVERLQATFAAVVSEWDADLGRLMALFQKRGLTESTLLMLTAGHGLSLGEHDWVGAHSEQIFDELSHLPLLIRLPNAEQGGRRIAVESATIDVVPTVFDALSAPCPAPFHGQSLLPFTHGNGLPRPYLVQALGSGQSAIRTADWVLLHAEGTASRLFRKPEDRWEMTDQRMMHLDWAEHLEAIIPDFIQTAGQDRFAPPQLRDYHDLTENDNEHGPTGERDDRASQGESDLRGHQGDQED